MILDYLKDRYLPENFPVSMEKAAEIYEQLLAQQGKQLFKTEKGFFIYSLRGDAAIMHDIYVQAGARQKGEAWNLFNAFHTIARLAGKRVLIGFSEYEGKNQHLGLIALKAAGFQPTLKLTEKQVFIREV